MKINLQLGVGYSPPNVFEIASYFYKICQAEYAIKQTEMTDTKRQSDIKT